MFAYLSKTKSQAKPIVNNNSEAVTKIKEEEKEIEKVKKDEMKEELGKMLYEISSIGQVLVDLKNKSETLQNGLESTNRVLEMLSKKTEHTAVPQIIQTQPPIQMPQTSLIAPKVSIKQKKKNYKTLTNDLIENKVLIKYPNFPLKHFKVLYTDNGEDLYVDFKKKKFQIENGGSVLKLINSVGNDSL